MSDDRQRATSRSAALGEAEQARELRERMRSGRLPPERVHLAAQLGHRAAQLALGEEPASRGLLDRVEQASFRAGKEVLVRLAFAAIQPVLCDETPALAQVRFALVGWLTGVDREHYEQLAALGAQELWAGPVLVMGQAVDHDPPDRAELGRRAVATAGRVLGNLAPYDRAELITLVQLAVAAVGEATVERALLEGLTPWALA